MLCQGKLDFTESPIVRLPGNHGASTGNNREVENRDLKSLCPPNIMVVNFSDAVSDNNND